MIERFTPSSGRWIGAATLAVLVVVAAFVAADGRLGEQIGVLCGLASAAWICWVTLVRPGVQARDDHLLLRNLLRDTEIPWHLVGPVRVGQTLRVRVDDRVHHGVALGRSARTDMRTQRHGRAGSSVTSPDYTEYVVDRLTRLATQRAAESAGRPEVTHRWAWVEIAVGVVLISADLAVWLT